MKIWIALEVSDTKSVVTNKNADIFLQMNQVNMDQIKKRLDLENFISF